MQLQEQPVDSLAAASPVDMTDTSGALVALSRDVGEAGRLLISGEWELFWGQFYGGLAGLVLDFVPKLLVSAFVFILFYVAYRVVYGLFTRLLQRSKKIDPGVQNLLLKSFRLIGLAFVVVMVLAQLGVNVVALLTAFGIAGIAIGFAARDTLENFISGIAILSDKPFRIGDNVEVEDVFGTVEEITLRSTRLRTLNNEYMVMPNNMMINQKLVNHTILGTIRIEVPFGIAYKEYPQRAREVVLKLTEGDERIHPDYKPEVIVKELDDSSVNMVLRFHLMNPKLETPVRFEYIEKVREALRKANIEIPFPHLQLHVDGAKAFDGTELMRK